MVQVPSDPKEVLNLALQNEEQGYKILSDASNACEDKLAKATFDFLAKEEIKHIEIIKHFAETGEAIDPSKIKVLEKIEVGKAIKGIFEQFGWQYEQAATTGYEIRQEAYRTAMDMERHGHHYYKQAAEQAQGEAAKEFYEFLAAEEIRHYEIIQETYEFLEQPDALLAMEERWMQM